MYYYTYSDGGDWSYSGGDYYYSDDGNMYYYSDDGYDYLVNGGNDGYYTTYSYGSGVDGGGSGIVWDGCTNDDSIGDEYDDTCSDYYDTNPGECGNYDTDTFIAADLCCACMSYGETYTTYSYGGGSHDG